MAVLDYVTNISYINQKKINLRIKIIDSFFVCVIIIIGEGYVRNDNWN